MWETCLFICQATIYRSILLRQERLNRQKSSKIGKRDVRAVSDSLKCHLLKKHRQLSNNLTEKISTGAAWSSMKLVRVMIAAAAAAAEIAAAAAVDAAVTAAAAEIAVAAVA